MVDKNDDIDFYENISIIKSFVPMDIARARQDATINRKLYLFEYKENIFFVNKYLKKHDKVLDIGSELGTLPAILSTYDYMSVGGDVMEPNWQLRLWTKLSEKFGCFFILYDGRFIPFKSNTFDVIIAYAVIEHIPGEMKGASKFLVECHQLLKKSGYLFIFKYPRKQSWTEFIASVLNFSHHENLIDEKEIIELSRQKSFDVLFMKRKDMVPDYIPTKIGQYLWDFFWRPLSILDKILEYTPLNYLSHNITLVLRKR